MGSATPIVLGLIAVGALGVVGVVSLPTSERRVWLEPPTAHEVGVLLTRVGCDASSLAAAGVSEVQTTVLVGAVKEHLQTEAAGIRAADDSVSRLSREVERLESALRAGVAEEGSSAALSAARASLASARADLRSRLEGVFAVAAERMNATQLAVVESIRASSSAGWDLPTPYLTMTQAEPAWVSLRDALANQRISAALGEDPDESCRQVVLSADAAGSVAQARANLDANLASVADAWNRSR